MQFKYLETERRNAHYLLNRGFAVVWMDGCNGNHLRMLLCQGKMGVVAYSDFVGMPTQSLVWPTEPHPTKAHQIDPIRFRLGLVRPE